MRFIDLHAVYPIHRQVLALVSHAAKILRIMVQAAGVRK
jgi:hypothetical protein